MRPFASTIAINAKLCAARWVAASREAALGRIGAHLEEFRRRHQQQSRSLADAFDVTRQQRGLPRREVAHLGPALGPLAPAGSDLKCDRRHQAEGYARINNNRTLIGRPPIRGRHLSQRRQPDMSAPANSDLIADAFMELSHAV